MTGCQVQSQLRLYWKTSFQNTEIWEHSSVVWHLPAMCKALGSIPSVEKKIDSKIDLQMVSSVKRAVMMGVYF